MNIERKPIIQDGRLSYSNHSSGFKTQCRFKDLRSTQCASDSSISCICIWLCRQGLGKIRREMRPLICNLGVGRGVSSVSGDVSIVRAWYAGASGGPRGGYILPGGQKYLRRHCVWTRESRVRPEAETISKVCEAGSVKVSAAHVARAAREQTRRQICRTGTVGVRVGGGGRLTEVYLKGVGWIVLLNCVQIDVACALFFCD